MFLQIESSYRFEKSLHFQRLETRQRKRMESVEWFWDEDCNGIRLKKIMCFKRQDDAWDTKQYLLREMNLPSKIKLTLINCSLRKSVSIEQEDPPPQTKYWREILLASVLREKYNKNHRKQCQSQCWRRKEQAMKLSCDFSCCMALVLKNNGLVLLFYHKERKIVTWKVNDWPVLPEAASPVMTIAWSSCLSDIDLNTYSVRAYLCWWP